MTIQMEATEHYLYTYTLFHLPSGLFSETLKYKNKNNKYMIKYSKYLKLNRKS